jgi:hypothetical protein
MRWVDYNAGLCVGQYGEYMQHGEPIFEWPRPGELYRNDCALGSTSAP